MNKTSNFYYFESKNNLYFYNVFTFNFINFSLFSFIKIKFKISYTLDLDIQFFLHI
jgi:hypothetical protein